MNCKSLQYGCLILNWFLSHRMDEKCLDLLRAKTKTKKKANHKELRTSTRHTEFL